MKRFATFAAIAMAVSAVSAAPELKLNGDVEFRLREESKLFLDSANAYYPEQSYSEFTTKYLWNLKLGVKVNENVSLKFRVSNPNGAGLETVYGNGKFKGLENNQVVAIPQAELQYKVGSFGLSAGIIEVKNNTVLNLVRSAEDGGYANSLDISNSWKTYYNESQTGLKLSYGITDGIKLNVTGSVAEYAKTSVDKETSEVAAPTYTDLRGIIDMPVSFGDFTVTPTLAMRNGISGEYETRKINTNGGVDFSGKFSDAFSLSAGAAYGMYRDVENGTKPSGLLLTAKPTVKFGMNKVSLGYSFGRSADLKLEGDDAYAMLFQHIDLKWGLGLAKNYTLTPRFRAWFNTTTAENSESSVVLRPEILFTAKF